MRNVKLTLEYDGTNYAGWQKQNNALTVEGQLLNAIKRVTGEDVKTIGCSRTDSGVHAENYIVNFYTDSTIPGDKFMFPLNNALPEDICITNSEEADLEFHARYYTTGKTYCYTILNKEQPSVLYRNYSYRVKEKLDVEAMRKACTYFLGTHDFEAFKTQGSSTTSSIRTLYDVHIDQEKDIIKIYATGDGFLYNMVRIMVGLLIEIGKGKKDPEIVLKAIELKNRTYTKKVAPPQGLMLKKVFY